MFVEKGFCCYNKSYIYEYSNTSWKEQLTNYNKEVIAYDNIGNLLTIGYNITLIWITGRSLNSYKIFL